jgi:hypothetical protein
MLLELYCPGCGSRFAAPPDDPSDAIVARMSEEGPWYALGPGATFEEMVFGALLRRGAIQCPECRDPVVVGEASLAPRSGTHVAATRV